MKHLSLTVLAVGALLCVASGARAQVAPFVGGRPFGSPGTPGGGGFPNGGDQNASNQGRNNGNSGAVLQLPPDVERLVALDAYNTIIIQNKADSFKPLYQTYKTLHIPARGIARIFGGTVITTEELMGLDLVGGFGNNNGNFGGQNGTFGGQNGFNNGFNNGLGGGGGVGNIGGGIGNIGGVGNVGGGFNNGNFF